ncbi:rpsF [Scenedesmus sp. PABB004]|nr:rpsF [Scenedesmus sp. PABB004]
MLAARAPAAAAGAAVGRRSAATGVVARAPAGSSRAGVVARVAEVAAAPAPAYQPHRQEYKPLKPEDLSNFVPDPEMLKLPPGYHWYETMIVLRASINDQDRDEQLAKFEAYLNKEDCQHINALVRNRSRMAYPMKGNWDGMYVLYTYAAKRQTARNVQLLLSNPEAGSEDKILRHITLCRL